MPSPIEDTFFEILFFVCVPEIVLSEISRKKS